MRAVSVSAAFEMLFVIYLLHHTRVSSSSRVYALCKCSWRRPSLVQYFSTAFCLPMLFLCMLVLRPSQGSDAWTALAGPTPRHDGGNGGARVRQERVWLRGLARGHARRLFHPPTKDLF